MWLRRAISPWHIEASKQSLKSAWIISSISSYSDTAFKKKSVPLQDRSMIDRCKLYVKGGYGGSGCSSTRRSRSDRYGRPDGGNGGRGGDVILECSTSVWDLSSLKHHVNGKRGGHGASKNIVGNRGEDQVIQVPLGTVIHLVKGEVPTVVETRSEEDLDPWEIPGTLDLDASQSDQQTTSSKPIIKDVRKLDNVSGLSSCRKINFVGSTSMEQVNQASLTESFPQISFTKESGLESSDICTKKGVSDQEDVETDADTTKEESEEEQIQYDVAELTEQGQRLLIARGGEGGLGNVSSSRKPMFSNNVVHRNINDEESDDETSSLKAGKPGSEAVIILELKSIADVGFVGMPNAGKSTLLGAISKAKPTIGNYAFTTLRPNLGNLKYDDLSITVADLPGLIKGAHVNRGLGHAFLRHIERTKVLAYVVDLAAALDGKKGIPPWEQLKDLVLELEFHQEGLSNRPSLVVANKIDEDGAEGVYEELKRRVQGVPIYPVCAVLEEGVPELKEGLRTLVHGGESLGLSLDKIVFD